MTTILFQPTSAAAFQFTATFDGAPYSVIVTWNISRRGWYINVYDQTNVRVFTMPLIGSPVDYDISMTAGYFTTTLVFREDSQTFEIT